MDKRIYYNCCCGSLLLFGNKNIHCKSRKHIMYLINNNLVEEDLDITIGCVFDYKNVLYTTISSFHH